MRSICMSLACLASATAFGQQVLTLDEAVALAIKNNKALEAARLEIDYQVQNKHQSSDIGKLSAKFVRGQINTYIKEDNSLTIEQNIPFPLAISAQHQLGDAMIKQAEIEHDVTRNELVYQVKRVYYNLLYLKAEQELFQDEDSIYAQLVNYTAEQVKDGNADLLEKVTAETQRNEVANQLALTEGDIIANRRKLQTLLNTDEDVLLAEQPYEQRTLSLTEGADPVVGNPQLALGRQQVEVDARQRKLAGAHVWPDLNIGFFSQTLIGSPDELGFTTDGSDRFEGFQVGVSIPLWIRPQLAKVKAATLAQQRDQAIYEYQADRLNGEWEEAVQTYLRNAESFDYYHNTALKSAETILSRAQAAYERNAIEYAEYWLSVRHALDIRERYLGALNEVNQSVVRLEYLAATEP